MGKLPIMGYWGLRGRGQAIRFILAYLGIEYEEKRYTNPNMWFSEKFSLGLDFPNIPYWIEGNVKLTETSAIVHFLAREKGPTKLLPETMELKRKGEMVESYVASVWTSLVMLCYTHTDEQVAEFRKAIPDRLTLITKFLGTNPYILGQKITYVDFLLYECLYHHKKYDAEILKNHPTLEEFMKRFESIPSIDKYIKSSEYIEGPCINPASKHPI